MILLFHCIHCNHVTNMTFLKLSGEEESGEEGGADAKGMHAGMILLTNKQFNYFQRSVIIVDRVTFTHPQFNVLSGSLIECL